MRLWSLHPRYLDPIGLVALWREGLLAQRVLLGQTRGYTRHPQLMRFRQHQQPLAAIAYYLHIVAQEAAARGYHFNANKIANDIQCLHNNIPLNEGQLDYERQHLLKKLLQRAPSFLKSMNTDIIEAHPIFKIVPGPVEAWEILR